MTRILQRLATAARLVSRGVMLLCMGLLGCEHQKPRQVELLPASPVSEQTARFHEIVQDGSFDELRAALEQGAPVNEPGRFGTTALIVAAEAKHLEKMKLLVEHGADLELMDNLNNTPLRAAVRADFVEGAQYLLSLGVDRGDRPVYPPKALDLSSIPESALPQELKGVLSEEDWNDSLKSVREMKLDPPIQSVICDASSLGMLKLLVEAGEDLNRAPNEVKRKLMGLPNATEFLSTTIEYRRDKSPRFGQRNPEQINSPFWSDMIRIGGGAYSAREQFHDNEPFRNPGAVWCFDRFGSSITPLPDGRFVQIAGEHEDHYDPDFHIYNDVVVHNGRGSFEIYGYPREAFPPTDFHSATLCPDGIYVIGCLGYPEQRKPGFTPVYRLSLDSWAFEQVETTGTFPSWIYEHRARYIPERQVIRVERGKMVVAVDGEDGEETDLVPNNEQFELDLSQRRWNKVPAGDD